MINVNISYKQNEGRYGHGYRSLSAKDNAGNQLAVNISGANPVDFIEVAVQEAVKGLIANNGAADDVTVSLPSEIVLSAGLQTSLSDKLSADPFVNSVVFAL